MQKIAVSILSIALLFALKSKGQVAFQPYSFQFYQKLNKEVYAPSTNFHTAVKPYILPEEGTIRAHYDSLMSPDKNDTSTRVLHQVFFNGHLWSEKNKDYTVYFDFLPDFQLGKQSNPNEKLWLNTRGVQFGGTVGKDFFFYSTLFENQGRLPDYENNYIQGVGMVPGQAYDRSVPKSDWAYVTGIIGYKFNKNTNLSFGEDKLFIGDGYRSVLLSDFSAPAPLLRLSFNLAKNIQYTAVWAYLQDQREKQFYVYGNNRRKWAAFHYIDWNITKRASLGFFNALITEEANDSANLHGFDFNYINPLLFSAGIQPMGTPTDHTLLGLNAKYKILNKTTVYGQLLFDEAEGKSLSSKQAVQIGLRGSDLFTLPRLNYLLEYNTAKPYTYANSLPINSYTQFREPLAHPFGANFKEYIAMINYSIKRFDFQVEVIDAKYGVDNMGLNYGKNIVKSENAALPTNIEMSTGQGLATTLKYAEGTIAYLLNPKYNLRLELTGLLRHESNALSENKTTVISFGLKGSFRNLYHDF